MSTKPKFEPFCARCHQSLKKADGNFKKCSDIELEGKTAEINYEITVTICIDCIFEMAEEVDLREIYCSDCDRPSEPMHDDSRD
jgi:hypothetical protein